MKAIRNDIKQGDEILELGNIGLHAPSLDLKWIHSTGTMNTVLRRVQCKVEQVASAATILQRSEESHQTGGAFVQDGRGERKGEWNLSKYCPLSRSPSDPEAQNYVAVDDKVWIFVNYQPLNRRCLEFRLAPDVIVDRVRPRWIESGFVVHANAATGMVYYADSYHRAYIMGGVSEWVCEISATH